jgi:hypothetical protein
MRCYEDNSTGKWVHEHRACLAATEYDCLCVYQSQQEDERKLDHLKLLSLPLLCFRDPEFAADQRTLQGLAQETCIYRTS